METSSTSTPSDTQYFTEQPEKDLLDHLILRELSRVNNFHLTQETIILRVLINLASSAHLPWSSVVETVTRPCLLDADLHNQIMALWEERKRNTTLDETQTLERLLGHDYVRPTDLLKLAAYLVKLKPTDMKPVWKLFAVDGFLGTDPKMYVDSFKNDEVKQEHAHAIRHLYSFVDTPELMKEIVDVAFERVLDEKARDVEGEVSSCVDLYIKMVPRIKEVKEWKIQQVEDAKKIKRVKKRKEPSDEATPGNEDKTGELVVCE